MPTRSTALSSDVRALGLDFLLCSAYKFYGPTWGSSMPGAFWSA
jgi:selenocysteine lyase/cysteine desulfurase